MHLEQINLLLTMIACWQLINSSNSTFSEIFKQVLLLSNKMKPIYILGKQFYYFHLYKKCNLQFLLLLHHHN